MKTPSQSARAKIYRLKQRHAEELAEQKAWYEGEIADLKAGHKTRNSVLCDLTQRYELLTENLSALMLENEKLKRPPVYGTVLDDGRVHMPPPPQPQKLSWWQRFRNWLHRLPPPPALFP